MIHTYIYTSKDIHIKHTGVDLYIIYLFKYNDKHGKKWWHITIKQVMLCTHLHAIGWVICGFHVCDRTDTGSSTYKTNNHSPDKYTHDSDYRLFDIVIFATWSSYS